MKWTTTILLTLVLSVQSQAQIFPSEQWHEGQATLKDNRVVKGQLRYDLERDAIQIRVGDRIETYSSQLVFKFSLIQSGDDFVRRFFTLPYANQPGYKSIPRFFEVIVEGKMTLLAREYIAQVTTGNRATSYNRYRGYSVSQGNRTATRSILTYKMFFLDHEGNLVEHSGRKKDIYIVLRENSGEVKKYIKSHRLKVDKLEDVAKLVAHYNTLI